MIYNKIIDLWTALKLPPVTRMDRKIWRYRFGPNQEWIFIINMGARFQTPVKEGHILIEEGDILITKNGARIYQGFFGPHRFTWDHQEFGAALDEEIKSVG